MAGFRFLLDTNILSDLARQPQGRVFAALQGREPHTACTSIVVAAEISFGVQRNGSDKLRRQMQLIMSRVPVLPLQSPAEEHYADIRTEFERAGTPIGSNDLLIAAHARSLGLTLVTHNQREFQRVPGLVVEDWLA